VSLPSWVTPSLALKLAAAAVLSLAVVALVPHTVDSGGDVPPVRMLLVTATITAAICSALLFWGLRSDLRLPAKVAVYAVVFNIIVVVVKLALAPHGFYEVNQRHDIDSTFAIDNSVMASLAAVCVFALYLCVFTALYKTYVKRLDAHDPVPDVIRGSHVAVGVVVLTVLLVATGGAILLLLLPLAGGLTYLQFVFESSLSLMIGVLLACATAFAALAFNSTAARARVVGNAQLFLSFFWVGLYFLALYHALWVVYVLVLTSIWPLKVVTPK
jgi:hypothetical protein